MEKLQEELAKKFPGEYSSNFSEAGALYTSVSQNFIFVAEEQAILQEFVRIHGYNSDSDFLFNSSVLSEFLSHFIVYP